MSERAQDERAITAVVQKYIESIANTRPADMLEVFHPQAIMAAQFDGQLNMVSGNVGQMIADYMSKSPPTAEHSPRFQGRILSVKQHGDIAAVEIAEDQLEGRDMKTFFLLNKVNGAWCVTSKATTNSP